MKKILTIVLPPAVILLLLLEILLYPLSFFNSGGGVQTAEDIKNSAEYKDMQLYYEEFDAILDELLLDAAEEIVTEKEIYMVRTRPYISWGLAYAMLSYDAVLGAASKDAILDFLEKSVQIHKEEKGDGWYVSVSYEYPDELSGYYRLNAEAEEKLTLYAENMGGDWTLTGYCPCEQCSEGWGNSTSSGATAAQGRTVAVDLSVIEMGSGVIIGETMYIAEDVGGGVKGHHIDIYFQSHDDASVFKKTGQEVYVVPPEEVKGFSAYCSYSETRFLGAGKEEFVHYYNSYLSILEEQEITTATRYTEDAPEESGSATGEMPLYLQYSAQWGSIPFGGGTISSSGCSVTCIAMVASYLKNASIYPSDVVAWTGATTYYVPGQGASWSIFPAAAKHYGLRCKNLGKDGNKIKKALKKGKPVIASMGPGTFTSNGHFIVLRGMDAEGKILVNDPNDSTEKNHVNKAFTWELIDSQAKNYWRFGKSKKQ